MIITDKFVNRSQAIGKQAYELLEAPRGSVWGAAARAVAQGRGRQAPGFEAAFIAHDGHQTFEVRALLTRELRVCCAPPC